MRELIPQLHVSLDGPGNGRAALDLWTFMETRGLVVGGSRSGKTHMLYWLLQMTYGQVQHIVIDREADFVPLRGPYEYMVVGAEGDIPINLRSSGAAGKLIREILRLRMNTIFDLSDIDEEERHEYVRRLFTEMANIPRQSGLWTPALVLVDEAHTFAPEAGQDQAVSTRAMASLASRGAKRGYNLVVATQRLASLSNKVAALCENRLILRTADEDIERASKMLGMKPAEARKKLRSLERGTGYAYGNALSIDPELVRVPSDLKVLPPKRGELRAAPPPAPEALQMLVAQVDAVAEDEEEARTIEQLEEEISALQYRLDNPDPRIVEEKAQELAQVQVSAERRRVAMTLRSQLGVVMRQLDGLVGADAA